MKTHQELVDEWRTANPEETLLPDWTKDDFEPPEQYQYSLQSSAMSFVGRTARLKLRVQLVELKRISEHCDPELVNWPGAGEVLRRLGEIMIDHEEWFSRWGFAMERAPIIANENHTAVASMLVESAIRDAFTILTGIPWDGLPADED